MYTVFLLHILVILVTYNQTTLLVDIVGRCYDTGIRQYIVFCQRKKKFSCEEKHFQVYFSSMNSWYTVLSVFFFYK